jgi:hypothetical protein
METLKLLGIFEIAEMANVNPSAVANWRKRFIDFPQPVVDLKSGPVFQESQVRLWLQRKNNDDLQGVGKFYDQLAVKRNDSSELTSTVEKTVEKLLEKHTSLRAPGMLLGRIQSGKTRAFLGVIARSFDNNTDIAIILTKGTRSLAKQTLTRVKKDFSEFIANDQMQVFDIMSLPNLTPYELNQKIVFIVKKEADNLSRLLTAIKVTHPELQTKRALIIDDEADLASVSFRKKNGEFSAGTISQQIDELRELFVESDFLQVTATPYSLYLQPEGEAILNGTSLFLPKRPAFTEVLKVHDQYVGGNYYFEKSSDPDSPAYYFYREVPLSEREALKSEDRRRLRIENIITEKNGEVLRDAILTFLTGGAIRRLQQSKAGTKPEKYSFLFHTEQKKNSHEWQERVTIAIKNALVQGASEDSPLFDSLLRAAFSDLKRSVVLEGSFLPDYEAIKKEVTQSLITGQLMITKVNSDKGNEIDELLDDDGQLKLRTPFNIFIGGQILDRGITINNLIAFYYGRNPQRFQQDTVLQHSRMYGARSLGDLAVTRFYAPLHVFQIMRKIHEFDAALRTAFESGAHARGVYFIQKDEHNRLVPCSPNKLAFSNVVSVRPGRRMVPMGFQTVAKTNGKKNLTLLDDKIASLNLSSESLTLVNIDDAVDLLALSYSNLVFDDANENDQKAYVAALEHSSQTTANPELQGKVFVLTGTDRNVARYREEGRFSNAPDTKQQAELAQKGAQDIPVLMLLRQNGTEEKGWRGLPFWWPVIVPPKKAITCIFAMDSPTNP